MKECNDVCGSSPTRPWRTSQTTFLKDNTKLTGTLKLGAAVKTIGTNAFYKTKLTGLDLSAAASLESIGDLASYDTDIMGNLVIPANVETIADHVFADIELTGLDLSDAASLVSIGAHRLSGAPMATSRARL